MGDPSKVCRSSTPRLRAVAVVGRSALLCVPSGFGAVGFKSYPADDLMMVAEQRRDLPSEPEQLFGDLRRRTPDGHSAPTHAVHVAAEVLDRSHRNPPFRRWEHSYEAWFAAADTSPVMAERVHSPGVRSDLANGLPPDVGDGRGAHSAIASFETVPLSANEPPQASVASTSPLVVSAGLGAACEGRMSQSWTNRRLGQVRRTAERGVGGDHTSTEVGLLSGWCYGPATRFEPPPSRRGQQTRSARPAHDEVPVHIQHEIHQPEILLDRLDGSSPQQPEQCVVLVGRGLVEWPG